MKIREYENYSGGGVVRIDYANDLFLDFAFENGAVAARDYDLMLRKEKAKQRPKYAYPSYEAYCEAMDFQPN